MKEQMEVGLPEKLELQKFSDYIHISRKWFGYKIIFMTIFALFWNIFLLNFYANMEKDADVFAKIFPLIHVVVGIGISYYALAGWFNKSNIFVSKERIEINHKPIPWFGHKKIKSSELKQLYSKENVSNNRNNTTVTYEVHAILHNGTNTKLISDLDTSEQALYIEQEIEKYLGIKDSLVKGAIG
jgi:hypothetical protein